MKSRIKQFMWDWLRNLPPQPRKHLEAFKCDDLIALADKALIQAAYSYGHESIFHRPVDYFEFRMRRSMDLFFEEANHAHLVDMINWARFCWRLDTRRKAYYQDSSGEGVPGSGR